MTKCKRTAWQWTVCLVRTSCFQFVSPSAHNLYCQLDSKAESKPKTFITDAWHLWNDATGPTLVSRAKDHWTQHALQMTPKLSVQQPIRKPPIKTAVSFSRQLWCIFCPGLRQTAQTPFQPSYQATGLSTWVSSLSRPPGGEWMVRRGKVTLKSWEVARQGRLVPVWMLSQQHSGSVTASRPIFKHTCAHRKTDTYTKLTRNNQTYNQ